MDISLIGSQILKFRKQLGMTQKELGTAIGVSTQAVSQWENGGAPDVSLLPAIADKLGVTVDALFGRESGEVRDMTGTLAAWLRTQPEEGRIQSLSRLLWEASLQGLFNMEIPNIEYPKTSEQLIDGECIQMRMCMPTEHGYIFGVGGEDMSYMCVLPEPEEGYERYFLDHDANRKIFAALAIPGSLELLMYLSHEDKKFYIASTAAKHIGATEEEAAQCLTALEDVGILAKIELEIDTGVVPAYMINEHEGIVPLLYFARWISKAAMFISTTRRQRPILKPREKKDHEKN